MEWSKAKIYMIIAFAVTNLLLLLSINSNRIYYSDEFDKKSLRDLKILLENKNVKCDEKLSIKSRRLSGLEIRYAKVKDDRELKKIEEKYRDNVKIIDDMYMEIHISDMKNDIESADDLQKFAENFISENFSGMSYKIKTKVDEDGYFSIDYEQMMGNVFIDEGYLKFASNDKKSVDISIFKTNAETMKNRNINVISNAQAVSEIIPRLKSGDVIDSVTLGYAKIKENEQDKQQVLRYVRLVPYWRIKINSDEYLFVEAVKLK